MDRYPLSLYAVDRLMKNQFSADAVPERPDHAEHQRVGIGVAVRQRLSSKLHTLANVIEPASRLPEYSPNPQH